MPVRSETIFARQKVASKEQIGVVIPATAQMLPEVRRKLDAAIRSGLVPPAAESATSRSFHYLPVPFEIKLLADGARVNTGIYEFVMRDAVIEVFGLLSFTYDEFCWAFSSTQQIHVLAALRIGQTLDIRFEHPLERAYHVNRYHFPPPQSGSGYGQYAVHLSIDGLSGDGFRVVSSYEPQSQRSNSRLPFLFGFQVFGRQSADPPFPVWRELLAEAVRQAMWANWDLALMYATFSVESFIDILMSERLGAAQVGDSYIDHVLRVADRKHELHALNHRSARLSTKEVNRTYARLNEALFAPRNGLVHGRQLGSSIDSGAAVTAIKTAVTFAWDWDEGARPYLLARMRPLDHSSMVDAELLGACEKDLVGESQ
jgi:hypothetical protein